MPTKSPAKREAAQLPALANTPAMEIESDDIALPRLYVAQFSSQAFKDGNVKAGEVYSAAGQHDPDPQVLSDGDEPLRFHVLGMTKGKSWINPDTKELVAYNFADPDAPQDAYTTYRYLLALPTVADDLPFKYLLKKTASGAARAINTPISRNQGKIPACALAFELRTQKKSNPKGDYFVPVVRQVEADNDEHIKIAAALSEQVAGSTIASEPVATGNAPSI